jgi:uncharacterized membrane protein
MTGAVGLPEWMRIESRLVRSGLLALVTCVVGLLLLASLATAPVAATTVTDGDGATNLQSNATPSNTSNESGMITVKERGQNKEADSARRQSAVSGTDTASQSAGAPDDRVRYLRSVDGRPSTVTHLRDSRASTVTRLRDSRGLSGARLGTADDSAQLEALSIQGKTESGDEPLASARRTDAWDQQAVSPAGGTGSRITLATRWGAILFASVLMNVVLGSLVLFRRIGSRTASRLAGPLEPITPGKQPDIARDPEPTTDTEARSDEEIVKSLLKDHGGQMRQSEIVEQREWSKAKVSRILCEMDSNAEIVKIQIGRENLICLEGQEPDIAKPMT